MALFLVKNGHRGATSTDYFTKWVEAEPLAQIREVNVIKFICNHIQSRFGIPRAFMSNTKNNHIAEVLARDLTLASLKKKEKILLYE